jgi:hypothetical protein
MTDDPTNDDAGWAAERQWLTDRMRRGLLALSPAEEPRVTRALDRLFAEVPDTPERFAIHEAGHAVVAYVLGWLVEFVEPRTPDGGAGAMTHQRRLGYSKNTNEAALFREQIAVGIAGYLAEEMVFGVAVPYEALDLRERAWNEFGVDDVHFGLLMQSIEAQMRAILTERRATVDRLAEAQLVGGRVEGQALDAILPGCFPS